MTSSLETFLEQAQKENHSKEFIEHTTKYIEKLQSNNYPVLFSIQHLAIEVGMQSNYIKHLISKRELHYNYFLLQKKGKKKAPREIMAPKEELKFIQRWINYNILHKVQYNQYIQGFSPGTSILKNAQIHEGAKYLLKIDLLKFFDCIDEKRVYKIFRSFGYLKNLSWSLATLCTAKHRESYWERFNNQDKEILKDYIANNPSVLPQGAPTSPLLANLAATRMDKRIGELASKQNFKYSRYADDLCISADKKENLPSILLLTKIIEEEGFYINKEKTNLSKAGMKQFVTGLSITNGVNVEKKKRRKIFSHLYYARKFGLQSHISILIKKGEYKKNYQNWLLGNIAYHYSINKVVGQKMFEIYNKINWSIDIKTDIILSESTIIEEL